MASTVLFRYRYLIVIAFVLLAVAGYMKSRDRSVDILPELSPPLVEVQTEALGLSAEEVEALITVPLEADLLNGISWIKTIRSRSLPGLSSIVMVFEDGTDIWKARQLIQERLTQAHALPNVSRPPVMLQPLSSSSRVMQIGLSSEELSNIQISVEAHWVVRPRLLGVPGVANVSIWGMRNRQLQVLVDPQRLLTENVTLGQVVSTAGNALWFSPLSFLNASTPGSGGFIDTPNQRLTVRHVLPISSPDDLADVIVEGTDVRLGSVADVVEDHQPLIGDALVGDEPGVLLVIEKFPWADTVTVTEGVEAALQDLSLSLPGVEIDTSIFRPASFIESATANLGDITLYGSVILLLALIVILRDWRAIVLAIVVVPASLVTAATVLLYSGLGLDLLMITGLAAAATITVSDATMDVGWFTGSHKAAGLPERAASPGGSIGTLIFGTLIALLATLPLFIAAGVSGALFQSVALPYGVAVVTSLVVSAVLTPIVAALLKPGGSEETENVVVAASPSSGKGKAGLVFGSACILAAVGIGLFVTSDRLLVPTFKEGDIVVDWTAAPGTSHPAMARAVSNVVGELKTVPGVENVGAHIGRAITSDQVANVNTAQIWVKLATDAGYQQSLDTVRDIINQYPGIDGEVLNYSQDRTRQYRLSDPDTLTVRVFGYDIGILEDLAAKMEDLMAGVDGVTDVAVQQEALEPVVQIEADLERSKQFGIKPGDVRRTAAILLSGLEVGSLYEDQKVFEVVVWGAPDIRSDVTSIDDILIEAPDGGVIRLADVARVSVGALPTAIQRDAVSRYLDVTARIDDGDAGAIAEGIRSAISGIEFPLEYHAELLPDFEETRGSNDRLYIALLAALVGIFLLVQSAVDSWRLAATIFVSLVASASGVLIVVALTGNVLSLGAVAALLAIVGLNGRITLVLVRDYQVAEQNGQPFGTALVRRVTAARSRGILATAIGTALCFVPAIYLADQPGLETLGTFGLAVIGGLVTTAIVNLLAVPALYLLAGAGTAVLEKEGQPHAV